MELTWTRHTEVNARWPKKGRHILASFDDDVVVVYQAYRPEIADAAITSQRFVSPFSLQRMSWVKPNFLWMMYRCGWAAKPDQQRVLAVHLPRRFFENLLSQAVWSSFQVDRYTDQATWSTAVHNSDVRLQWDPDHDPAGRPQERRAIQLGIRGRTLEAYALSWPVRIEDITPMVLQQRQHASSSYDLLIPDERPLPLADEAVRLHLMLDQP